MRIEHFKAVVKKLPPKVKFPWNFFFFLRGGACQSIALKTKFRGNHFKTLTKIHKNQTLKVVVQKPPPKIQFS